MKSVGNAPGGQEETMDGNMQPRFAKQPGLLYLPTVIMEENKLVEKHAAQMGMKDFKVSWLAFTGGASTDAMPSGNADMVVSGATNLLLLWSKTNGAIMGIAGVDLASMVLVTRNPRVKSLADFTEQDKTTGRISFSRSCTSSPSTDPAWSRTIHQR
jgi:ABC-type nitrate/sulfonate/bicarbonate transport system substrate-binding protein